MSTVRTPRTDIEIRCQNGSIWYSRWQLTKMSKMYATALDSDPDARSVEAADYTMMAVGYAILRYERIEGPSLLTEHSGTAFKFAFWSQSESLEAALIRDFLSKPTWGNLECMVAVSHPRAGELAVALCQDPVAALANGINDPTVSELFVALQTVHIALRQPKRRAI